MGAALVVIATAGALAASTHGGVPAEQSAQNVSSEGSGLVPSEENKESGPENPRPPDPTPAFNRDCAITNLEESDVVPPMREVACFLRAEFPEITMVLGTSPQPKGSDHQRGLAIDVFASPPVIDQIKKHAALHFDDWHLRNIIHGDQIMVTRGEGFRPLKANEGPGMDEYVHLALRDASPITASRLVQ